MRMGLLDAIFGRRDVASSPVRMIGFPSDGGLVTAGVTTTTTLGLSAVWRCLDILSNGVSQLDWLERRGNLDLPPSRIVTRPQSWRTRREWTSLVVSTMALFDVAHLWKVGGTDAEGVPIGLWPLDPSIVQPLATQDFWQILPPDEYWVGQTRVPRDELVILHRSPQPGISDVAGGVIKLARVTFAAALAAEGYASRYWQAGGAPTTVLETDARMDPTEAVKFSDKWRERRSQGPDYAPVLTGGLKAKSFGADPTTESAVEARRELVADISRYFGCPTTLVNAPTGDSVTYSTSENADLNLLRFTLQNYVGAIQDAITDQLPGGRHMVMDVRRLTHGTFLARAQAYQLLTGNKAVMTPDEARDELGLAPIEDPNALNPPVAPAPAIPAQGVPRGG